MSDKPILFSGPMVRAILEGRKTMTRRVLKPQPYPLEGKPGFWNASGAVGGRICISDEDLLALHGRRVGTRLWVREAWQLWCGGMGDDFHITYKADDFSWQGGPNSGHIPESYLPAYYEKIDKIRKSGKKSQDIPSIHLWRWASRLTLEVTAVKVERLQDISEEDAWSEGCQRGEPTDNGGFFPAEQPHPDGGSVGWDDAKEWFADLWQTINGPGSWNANPWVAAYSFKVLSPTPISARLGVESGSCAAPKPEGRG